LWVVGLSMNRLPILIDSGHGVTARIMPISLSYFQRPWLEITAEPWYQDGSDADRDDSHRIYYGSIRVRQEPKDYAGNNRARCPHIAMIL